MSKKFNVHVELLLNVWKMFIHTGGKAHETSEFGGFMRKKKKKKKKKKQGRRKRCIRCAMAAPKFSVIDEKFNMPKMANGEKKNKRKRRNKNSAECGVSPACPFS